MSQPETGDKVFAHIDREANEYVKVLRKLIRQQSISTSGLGVEECAKLVKELLNENGFRSKLIQFDKGAPIVYGESRPFDKEKTLLFYSHYDVVPPEPLDQWIHGPFESKVIGNKIIGRGSADTKCSIAAYILGAAAVLNVAGELPSNIRFVFEGEEEISSQNLSACLKERPSFMKADAMLWEASKISSSGRPTIYAGLKGSLYMDLYVRSARSDQHSLWAPIVTNPAWRLVWALNSIKNGQGRVLIEGFYDELEEPGVEEVKAMNSIEFDETELRRTFGIDEFLNRLKGVELVKALVFDPTCTICGFNSGYGGESIKTINPAKAVAKLDFRLVPNQSCQEVLKKLLHHLDKGGFDDVEVKVLRMAEAIRTRLDSRIVKVTANTAQKLFGSKACMWPMSPGSAVPISLFWNLMGIPSVSGPCMVHPEGNAHAPNENILIPNYIRGIKHLASIIMNF